MRKSCKQIDLRNKNTVRPWVWDAIKRHSDRYDFRDMLMEYGVSREDYYASCLDHDLTRFSGAVDSISLLVTDCIARRTLKFARVRIRKQRDGSSGKERDIGCESAMQQVFDSVARYAPEDIWRRRIVPQQASSIKGRGPLYGADIILRWILADNRAIRYAKSHGIPYVSKMKYFVKLDIRKCFPSARLEVFMELFRRDCANEDLLWLWEELLKTHRVEGYQGFMIGANVSQWGMQYMTSFIYRYAMSLATVRRGKRIPMVTHMLLFMDDILMTGSNRKNLKSAVRKVIRFTKDTLGLEIKETWHIKDLETEPIDMMGYVFHRSGKRTMRARVFIRGRRMVLRYHARRVLTIEQARRLVSYKGFFKHSDSLAVCHKLQAAEAFEYAAGVVSRHDKEVL